MAPTTRRAWHTQQPTIVPLQRCDAMRPVRFTRRGRCLARALLMESRAVHMYSVTSDRAGQILAHHLTPATGGRGTTRTFPALARVPEFEPVR